MNSEPSIGPDSSDTADRGKKQSTAWLLARVLAVGSVLALLALLILGLIRGGDGARFVSKIANKKTPPAPSFSLSVLWPHDETWPEILRPHLADGRLTLRELRGQPTVINFWASWCVPCKEEAPAFAAEAERFSGRVAFVGLNVQDAPSAARRFLRHYKVNYVSIRDGSDKTYTAYGLTGIPESYFLDRRGRVIEHAIGGLSKSHLAANVEALLKESP